MPDDLHLWLKHHAVDERDPMSAIIVRFVQEYRAKAEKKKPKK